VLIFFLAGLKLLPYLTLESPLLSYLILYGKASSIMYSFIKQNLKNPANVALLYLCLLPLLDKFVNELNGIILLSRSPYMRQLEVVATPLYILDLPYFLFNLPHSTGFSGKMSSH
jgi:hypothetical protein